MTEMVEIYVNLISEDVDVCRPVLAERIGESVYRIADQPYDREIEEWEFGPGDVVTAEPVIRDGDRILLATGPRRRD